MKESYQVLGNRIRAHVLRMVHRAKSGHVGTSFSMIDILVVLYYAVLRVDPADLGLPRRDRFILSKGHGCAALYAVLAERGFFPLQWLDTYYLDGSHLAGHVTHHGIPGVEVSTGSLGHGLPIGCGMAVAAKHDNMQYRVFVVLGDGECDEGSIWEAALFASHHRLDNLIAIVDYNKIQSLGRVKDVLNLEPFLDKWKAFGWAVKEIDGHNYHQIEESLNRVPFERGKPSCIIAHTVKGKGVSFMENSVIWHYSHPDDKQLVQALSELGF